MKSLISGSFRAGVNLADNTTRYFHIAGGIANISNESLAEAPIRHAGSFNYLFVRGISNTNTVDGTTFTLRKNGAGTGLTVSYLALQSGIKEDTTNSVSFANTDEACIEGNAPNDASGARLFVLVLTGVTFSPDTTTDGVCWMSVDGSNKTINTADTHEYFMPAGFNGTQATEAWQSLRIRAAFTASNLYTAVTSNARLTDTVFRSRKNSANGGMVITYSSLQSGVKEDTSGTDSLAIGDDYNYDFTSGTGTQSLVLVSITSILHSSQGYFQMMWGAGTGSTYNQNTTQYQAINSARGSAIVSPESTVQIYPRFDFTASEFGANVETNTFTTLATVARIRDNSANGNMSVSYGGGVTGVLFDSVNTDTISIEDEINYQVVTPNQAGNIQFLWIAALGKEIVSGRPRSSTYLIA